MLFCVNPFTGQVRHINDAAQCSNGQVVEVNREGPPGPEGPQGERGPEGPRGPAGPPGAGNTFRSEVQVADVPPSAAALTIASCEPGEFATGGGFTNTFGELELRDSRPGLNDDGIPSYWQVTVNNPTGEAVRMEVFVICASQ